MSSPLNIHPALNQQLQQHWNNDVRFATTTYTSTKSPSSCEDGNPVQCISMDLTLALIEHSYQGRPIQDIEKQWIGTGKNRKKRLSNINDRRILFKMLGIAQEPQPKNETKILHKKSKSLAIDKQQQKLEDGETIKQNPIKLSSMDCFRFGQKIFKRKGPQKIIQQNNSPRSKYCSLRLRNRQENQSRKFIKQKVVSPMYSTSAIIKAIELSFQENKTTNNTAQQLAQKSQELRLQLQSDMDKQKEKIRQLQKQPSEENTTTEEQKTILITQLTECPEMYYYLPNLKSCSLLRIGVRSLIHYVENLLQPHTDEWIDYMCLLVTLTQYQKYRNQLLKKLRFCEDLLVVQIARKYAFKYQRGEESLHRFIIETSQKLQQPSHSMSLFRLSLCQQLLAQLIYPYDKQAFLKYINESIKTTEKLLVERGEREPYLERFLMSRLIIRARPTMTQINQEYLKQLIQAHELYAEKCLKLVSNQQLCRKYFLGYLLFFLYESQKKQKDQHKQTMVYCVTAETLFTEISESASAQKCFLLLWIKQEMAIEGHYQLNKILCSIGNKYLDPKNFREVLQSLYYGIEYMKRKMFIKSNNFSSQQIQYQWMKPFEERYILIYTYMLQDLLKQGKVELAIKKQQKIQKMGYSSSSYKTHTLSALIQLYATCRFEDELVKVCKHKQLNLAGCTGEQKAYIISALQLISSKGLYLKIQKIMQEHHQNLSKQKEQSSGTPENKSYYFTQFLQALKRADKKYDDFLENVWQLKKQNYEQNAQFIESSEDRKKQLRPFIDQLNRLEESLLKYPIPKMLTKLKSNSKHKKPKQQAVPKSQKKLFQFNFEITNARLNFIQMVLNQRLVPLKDMVDKFLKNSISQDKKQNIVDENYEDIIECCMVGIYHVRCLVPFTQGYSHLHFYLLNSNASFLSALAKIRNPCQSLQKHGLEFLDYVHAFSAEHICASSQGKIYIDKMQEILRLVFRSISYRNFQRCHWFNLAFCWNYIYKKTKFESIYRYLVDVYQEYEYYLKRQKEVSRQQRTRSLSYWHDAIKILTEPQLFSLQQSDDDFFLQQIGRLIKRIHLIKNQSASCDQPENQLNKDFKPEIFEEEQTVSFIYDTSFGLSGQAKESTSEILSRSNTVQTSSDKYFLQ